jgi:hypothetical protein
MKESSLPTSAPLSAIENTGDGHAIDFTLLPDVRHTADQQIIGVAPGIDRTTYLLLWLATLLGSICLNFVLSANSVDSTITVGIIVITALAQLFFASLRLSNIGYNRWWCLLGIVPIASLVIWIICILRPTNNGRVGTST